MIGSPTRERLAYCRPCDCSAGGTGAPRADPRAPRHVCGRAFCSGARNRGPPRCRLLDRRQGLTKSCCARSGRARRLGSSVRRHALHRVRGCWRRRRLDRVPRPVRAALPPREAAIVVAAAGLLLRLPRDASGDPRTACRSRQAVERAIGAAARVADERAAVRMGVGAATISPIGRRTADRRSLRPARDRAFRARAIRDAGAKIGGTSVVLRDRPRCRS
jgi:hypothetical protein